MAITEARKRMNEQFRWVIREGLTNCLRRHGFKHKGTMYHWCDRDPTVACAITVKKVSPQFVEPDAVGFYFVCGMFVRAFYELFPIHGPNAVPNAFLSQLRVNPEELTTAVGWEFRFESDATQGDLANLARSLFELFENTVLPWYARFRTAKDVGDYMTSPGNAPGQSWISYREIKQDAGVLRKAAVAYFGAGEYGRALDMLDLATATIDRHGRHLTADLRERIERLIAQRQQDHAKS